MWLISIVRFKSRKKLRQSFFNSQFSTLNSKMSGISRTKLGLGVPDGAPSPSSAAAQESTNPPSDNPSSRCLGWYSRGYLPHFDSLGAMQFITFRLADSLPQTVLNQLEKELEEVPENQRVRERYRRIERWLDAGLGCCALGHPRMAEVVQETLLMFDPERYRLIA
jgi:hypothetical protein